MRLMLVLAAVSVAAACSSSPTGAVADARLSPDGTVVPVDASVPDAPFVVVPDALAADAPVAAADAPVVVVPDSAAGAPDAHPPDAHPIDAPPVIPDAAGPSTTLIAEHALAQEGLAIALASTVLQSQLNILEQLDGGGTTCRPLDGGGSIQAGPAATPRTVTVYYDGSCTKPFIVAVANLTEVTSPNTDQTDTISETATYFGLTGATLGVMTIDETAFAANSSTGDITLHGLASFAPTSGAVHVQLGLECVIPGGDNPTAVDCAGGIAQDFPALGLALGSVTPLVLVPVAGSDNGVTFSGTNSNIVSGATGALTLSAPTATTLAISGGSAFAASNTSGAASEFVLFPPTPTGWSIVDPGHDLTFTINVVDNTVRNSVATITTTSTGATLATAAIDQAGVGTITYSDASSAAIASWTLAD